MVVDEAYFAEIKDPRTGFRGLTVRDIIAHCEQEYPSEPEDHRIVEDMLREEWDPGEHISKLWEAMQKKLRLFAVIERGPGHTYTREFVKYAYITIEATKEFTEDCEKWKHQIPGMRNTEAQLKTHFNKAYKLYMKKGASMREAHIANQAEIVSILAAKSQEVEELRNEVATSIAQERASMETYIANHTADQTVFSAMTASTEQLHRRNEELQAQLAAANASNRGTGGSGGQWSNHRGGGRGGGGGGSSSTAGGTPWSNRSTSGDGSVTPWANRSTGGSTGGGTGGGTHRQSSVRQYIHYCWSHGCNANHDSKNCPRFPRNPRKPETARHPEHEENATFENMMGGNPRMLERRWHWLDENNKCTEAKPLTNNN